MLRIFTPVKIQRLWPGLNPQTWVPEASMLTTRPPKPSNIRNNVVLCLLLHVSAELRHLQGVCTPEFQTQGRIIRHNPGTLRDG